MVLYICLFFFLLFTFPFVHYTFILLLPFWRWRVYDDLAVSFWLLFQWSKSMKNFKPFLFFYFFFFHKIMRQQFVKARSYSNTRTHIHTTHTSGMEIFYISNLPKCCFVVIVINLQARDVEREKMLNGQT